jgi:hypothetical protein
VPIASGAGPHAILAGGRDRTKGSLSDGKIVTIVTGTTSASTGTTGVAGITGSPVSLSCQHADTVPLVGPAASEPEDGIDERMLRGLAERVRSERLRHNLRWSARPQVQAEGRQAQGKAGIVPPRR